MEEDKKYNQLRKEFLELRREVRKLQKQKDCKHEWGWSTFFGASYCIKCKKFKEY